MTTEIDRAALIAEAAEYDSDSAWCGNLIQDLAEALARSEREIAEQAVTIEAARTWARWPFEGNNKGSEPNWDALDCILAGKTTTTPYPTNA